MRRLIPILALLTLAGCVAYPAPAVYDEGGPGYAIAPAPVYVAPPTLYFGGSFGGWGGGYRGPYRGGHRGHRHWR